MKIGVVLPMAEDPKTGSAPSYTEIRGLARQAEALGVDSVWLYDHLLYRFPERPTFGIWECWTLLCALAEATERVELGTIVLCTAFRNPAVLAKMAATLDEVSGVFGAKTSFGTENRARPPRGRTDGSAHRAHPPV